MNEDFDLIFLLRRNPTTGNFHKVVKFHGEIVLDEVEYIEEINLKEIKFDVTEKVIEKLKEKINFF